MDSSVDVKNGVRERDEEAAESLDFIRSAVAEDNASGRFGGRVQTRFPPEPNGYLHIGHVKAIAIDFGVAEDFGGICNLRFDDTNPEKEEQEYVDGQIADMKWLGFEPANIYYASDYFDQLYEWAVELISQGKAYVDDLSAEEMREYRGTLTEPGRNSPYRDRSVEENLDLFARMKAGEFPDGSRVLRAKIDMSSGNLNLRDPAMYRIRHAEHQRTGNKWCIYPMYDWAHGQSDSIEGVTHSLCSLEYEDHRPLYDWYLEQLGVYHPRQIEFARLFITHTLLSKRVLIRLVNDGLVSGWDDPRMPTVVGMRRRGVPAAAIREFVDRAGVSKTNSTADIALLDFYIRQELNRTAPRVMGVLDPIKVVITNYPAGQVEWLEAINNPEDESAGTRQVPFSDELFIDRDDFQEVPHRKFFRLAPGQEVRLRYGYFITCTDVVKNESGEIVELHCTYDPETKGGYAPDGRRVKGTIHWLSAAHALDVEVRMYDRLFAAEDPGSYDDFSQALNPNSLEILPAAKVEPSLTSAEQGTVYQFERKGYFCVDSKDSRPGAPIFNQTIGLRDSWAKIQGKG
ncbi:MAG: glutamine--tRNA ligase/YqeY domain fusion protein [Caldilineaceae bacterium]|nr:glutamine--tRNA ligase/YqeY domain fusion protein [Caldilineaceae bacterium]